MASENLKILEEFFLEESFGENGSYEDYDSYLDQIEQRQRREILLEDI